MSILPRCICGVSSYCTGGPLCGMPTGDDVPLFSMNYVNQLRDEIRELKQLLQNSSIKTTTLPLEIGDMVKKVTGDYNFQGIVVASFEKLDGKKRYVVEDDRGILHIYSRKNLDYDRNSGD